jgi:hypothetical protein
MKKMLVVTAIVLMVAAPLFEVRQVTAVDLPNVTVTPNHFELNLTGGSRINKSITLVWTGDYPIVVFFQIKITPDGQGMNLWFNEDPVSLLPDTSKKINMSIKALVNIAPGHYKIDILAIADTNKLAELYNMTEQLKRQVAYLEGQIHNMTGTDISGMLTTIQGLKDTIDSLNTKITNMKNEPATTTTDNSLLLYVIMIFLLIIIVLIIFMRRRSQYAEGKLSNEGGRSQFEERIDTSRTRVPVSRARYVPDVDERDITEKVRQRKRWVHGPFE